MITLLAKLLIKPEEKESRQKYGVLCSVTGIMLNIGLFVMKFFAGVLSGSIAVKADAFNNLSDAGSSFLTLIGFKLAEKKPDGEHPFGHGRFEYLSGMMVSLAILVMGFELGKDSIGKILHPEPVETSPVIIGILICSVLVKLYMSYYNRKIGNQIDSSAMRATSMDSLSDCIATTVVLLAMLVMKFAHCNLDGAGGLLVALFILYAGYNASKETIGPLLGQAPEPEFVAGIRKIVLAHTEILGIHDLAVHDYGPGRCMISLHAEVSGNGNIYKIHDTIDNIEKELQTKLGCEAVIHMDPIETDNKIVQEKKAEIGKIIQQIDSNITMHDFRMVQGETHTNLIFDIVLPAQKNGSEEEVRALIKGEIQKRYPEYVPVITVDHSYV